MFPDRLKQLRKERGITQVQFAQEFNVSKGTIGMWEIGKREPDFETVTRIADYFHVSVDYLIGRDTQKETPSINIDEGRLDENLIRRLCSLTPEEQSEEMDLAGRIKLLREQAHLTQLELAQILNISNSALSQYESGSRAPSDEMKAKIADHFGVSLDYLYGRSNKPVPENGDGLSEEQREIVKLYETASPTLRAAALAVLKSSEGQGKAPGASSTDE